MLAQYLVEGYKLVEKLEKETDAKILIWFGEYYGACDIPLELNNYNIDFRESCPVIVLLKI